MQCVVVYVCVRGIGDMRVMCCVYRAEEPEPAREVQDNRVRGIGKKRNKLCSKEELATTATYC